MQEAEPKQFEPDAAECDEDEAAPSARVAGPASQGETAPTVDEPPRRPLEDRPGLLEILKRHEIWLSSAGHRGQRADLNNTDLQDMDFRGVHFRSAILEGANFTRADLRRADLFEAVLLKANLQDADLSTATGLVAGQLAGTNVSGAKLPEALSKFETLAHANDMAQSGARAFFLILLTCAYAWLTIGTTVDARLLTNSASSPLPIIQTQVPIVGFYWVAPILLFGLYVYFHYYMREYWNELALLPNIFPDGKERELKIYPWIVNNLVAAYSTHVRKASFSSRLQSFLSILLGWGLIPLTLFGLWFRYLARHDWNATSFQIALFSLAVGIGIWSYRAMSASLSLRIQSFTSQLAWLVGAVACLLLVLLSYGAIDGEPRSWPENRLIRQVSLPMFDAEERFDLVRLWRRLVPTILTCAFADFTDQSVSDRQDPKYPISGPHSGAHLARTDLRYASGSNVFLSHSDLRHALMNGVHFPYSDFTGSDLSDTILENAYFFQTIFREASFSTANLRGAYLGYTNLSKASAPNADLTNAILLNADLREADFHISNLTRASLAGADLRGARLDGAILVSAVLIGARMEGANLSKTRLHGADLREVSGLSQIQISQACVDATTQLPPGIEPPGSRQSETPCAEEIKDREGVQQKTVDPTERSCTQSPCKIILVSNAKTMAASIGRPGEAGNDIRSRLDQAPADLDKVLFRPALVGRFFSSVPIPTEAPQGTSVINIPPGDGRSGYFKLTFLTPPSFGHVQLIGRANVDDVGRVFLNGSAISPSFLVRSSTSFITEFGNVEFSVSDRQLFLAGHENVILIADSNNGGGPSGAAFYITIDFSP